MGLSSLRARMRADERGITGTVPLVAVGGAAAIVAVGTLSFAGITGAGGAASNILAATTANPCLVSTSFEGGLGDASATADQAQIIAAFKQQSFEMGLGVNGAIMATYVGLAESGLKNNTYGDRDENGNMSTSRGVFQQLEGWAGPTAWSGRTPPPGTRAGDYFTEKNAWGPNGWARYDRRMDPGLAAKWFLNSLKTRLAERDITPESFSRMTLTPDLMLDLSWAVQRWDRTRDDVVANNTRKVQPALALFAQHANTPVTVNASTLSTGIGSGDGALLLGDSLMQGAAAAAPQTALGGAVESLTEVGISASTAADRLTGQWRSTLDQAPSRIAVSLGTNAPGNARAFTRDINAVMEAAGPNRRVYWTTLHTPGTLKYNKQLVEATSRWPNLRLVDIQAMVEAEPGYLAEDGIHLTPAGYEAMWAQISLAMGGVGTTGITVQQDPCMNGLEGGITSPQTVVGPDGCPVEVAPNALRGTSASLGIAQICRTAVAGAPTPQAAIAIKWALSNLNIPYACWDDDGVYEGGRAFGGVTYQTQYQARSGPHAYDCSSWVGAAYASAGLNTRGHSTASMLVGATGYNSIEYTARMPGDLIVTETGRGAAGRHVKMYLGRINGTEYVAHTNTCGDVSKVEPYYGEGGDPILNVARPVATTKGELKRLATQAPGISA